MAAKYEDRLTVKNAGALWDPAVKKWCILPGNFWSNPTMWNQFEPRPVDNNNRVIDPVTV